jgi:hypothetical protein
LHKYSETLHSGARITRWSNDYAAIAHNSGRVSKEMLTIMVVNVELNESFVHLSALWKTDGLALQPFQMRPKVQILTLNVLRPAFTDPVLRPRNHLSIALPLIRAEAYDPAPLELPEQPPTALVGALADEPRDDLFRLWLKGIPKPRLLLFVADKWPHLIYFQLRDVGWQARSFDFGRVVAQQFQDGVGAHPQDSTDVANAAAIQAQGDDQLTHFGVMAAPRVVGDELPPTALTAVALFTGTTYAMLDDVPTGTPRAGGFFRLHDLRITCPSFLFSNISFETWPKIYGNGQPASESDFDNYVSGFAADGGT